MRFFSEQLHIPRHHCNVNNQRFFFTIIFTALLCLCDIGSKLADYAAYKHYNITYPNINLCDFLTMLVSRFYNTDNKADPETRGDESFKLTRDEGNHIRRFRLILKNTKMQTVLLPFLICYYLLSLYSPWGGGGGRNSQMLIL